MTASDVWNWAWPRNSQLHFGGNPDLYQIQDLMVRIQAFCAELLFTIAFFLAWTAERMKQRVIGGRMNSHEQFLVN